MIIIPVRKVLVVGGKLKLGKTVEVTMSVCDNGLMQPTIHVGWDVHASGRPAIEIEMPEIGPRAINCKLDFETDIMHICPKDMQVTDIELVNRIEPISEIAFVRSLDIIRFTIVSRLKRIHLKSCRCTFKQSREVIEKMFIMGDPESELAIGYFDARE